MPKSRRGGRKTRKHMPWAGWGRIAPQGHARTVMLRDCGRKCFLGPKKSFPICAKRTCKVNKKGLWAAYIRARQWGQKRSSYKGKSRPTRRRRVYTGVANKARRMLKSRGVSVGRGGGKRRRSGGKRRRSRRRYRGGWPWESAPATPEEEAPVKPEAPLPTPPTVCSTLGASEAQINAAAKEIQDTAVRYKRSQDKLGTATNVSCATWEGAIKRAMGTVDRYPKHTDELSGRSGPIRGSTQI